MKARGVHITGRLEQRDAVKNDVLPFRTPGLPHSRPPSEGEGGRECGPFLHSPKCRSPPKTGLFASL